MNWRGVILLFTALCAAVASHAHVGSPDLFHSGNVGPYPTRITIRMPSVVPGRAEISVRVETDEPLQVSFLPLYARTAAKNAPPPDLGKLVKGETALYSGELWLMSFGAYSVEVTITGASGSGSVQIPLTSVATRQLPMPRLLGAVLIGLAALLIIGGIAIAMAAAREATLAKGEIAGRPRQIKGVIAGSVTALIFCGALAGGRQWWEAEEKAFRRHLREGAWPDLKAVVADVEGQRILQLKIGEQTFKADYKPPSLIADHGKLMHLFMIREGERNAFAHLHPVRKRGYLFEVAVPPLPAGRYTVFCDLSFEGGSSSTAMTSVVLPEVLSTDRADRANAPAVDPDDSWAIYQESAVPPAPEPKPAFIGTDGIRITWSGKKQIRPEQDASLRFEISDSDGKPVPIEPYMGMLSHAAVLRRDGAVFAHLHPTGNYSMAAQDFFAAKLAKELGAATAGEMDHSMHQHHGTAPAEVVSSVEFPYEFPEAGDFRLWVQIKAAGRVHTGVFDARVE